MGLASLQVRIMLSVLQFRLNRRYVEASPPFIAIELDQSDSGREGCAVSTLTITSEPKDWRGAIQVLRALPPAVCIPCSVKAMAARIAATRPGSTHRAAASICKPNAHAASPCEAQRGGLQVAIEEVRRLQRFGVTAGELERYKMALLRDSAQAAEQALSVPSADQLDFIMESLALGHTVLDQRQVLSCRLYFSEDGNMCM